MPELSGPDISTVTSPPRCSLDYHQINDGELIGSGGQAVVRRVELPEGDPCRYVAVKEPQQRAETVRMDVIDSFFAEARTWKTLDTREREQALWEDSEHIVGIVDIGDELPWIAMEYMDGGGLDDRLAENPNGLPLDEALWIGECLCHGVKLAHDYGIAHLDLKPANVLFRETPGQSWDVPKIADWGLARVLIEHSGTMEALSVEYAAPEQFDPREFGDPDTYTDIYQLGVLVYALLVGEPPYTGTQTAIMHDVVYGDSPAPPSTVRTEVDQSIDTAVMTALAQEKGDRYTDVARFAEALRNARPDRPQVGNPFDNPESETVSDRPTNSGDESGLTFPWLNYERDYWKVPCPGCDRKIHNTKRSFFEHWTTSSNCDGIPEAYLHDPITNGIERKNLKVR